MKSIMKLIMKLTMKFNVFWILVFWAQLSFSQSLPTGHPPIGENSKVSPAVSNTEIQPLPSDVALIEFKSVAERLDVTSMRSIPTQHNGRIKPLDTLARESILYISGSYKALGLDPLQTFITLTISPAASFVELIEIREPELRTELGFLKEKRRFSLFDIEKSKLSELAQPLAEKEQRDKRSLTPHEKKILETHQQVWLTRSIIEGASFLTGIEFGVLSGISATQDSPIIQAGQDFLRKVASGNYINDDVANLVAKIKEQPLPSLLVPQLKTLEREVSYNQWRIFFWTALLMFLVGCWFLSQSTKGGSKTFSLALLITPMITIAIGLGIRVSITGFAPVTNMYGTMIWVALGVLIFSTLLFFLYQNKVLTGLLIISAALILFLTESIPLILSPDLDPIVAVLRGNYWLTIHVLTITISYAAFSIAMVLGNTALVRKIIYSDLQNQSFYQSYSHYTYRMIQLGVFLLTAGIILGGVWADYSWGRFWGWDPKETWALIADVGFIAILHARYTGWLKDFGTLASSTIAYLLVIMAWYGVNFILAAGLHSYGFSSGGALAVGIFVCVQLAILVIALGKHFHVLGGSKA